MHKLFILSLVHFQVKCVYWINHLDNLFAALHRTNIPANEPKWNELPFTIDIKKSVYTSIFLAYECFLNFIDRSIWGKCCIKVYYTTVGFIGQPRRQHWFHYFYLWKGVLDYVRKVLLRSMFDFTCSTIRSIIVLSTIIIKVIQYSNLKETKLQKFHFR